VEADASVTASRVQDLRKSNRVMCKSEKNKRQDFVWSLGGVLAVALLGVATVRAEQTNQASARELFVKNCAVCHSQDGTARTPFAKKLGVKDLSQSKLTEAQIVQQILDGRQEGQGASKMPAFKDKLSREEIASLVTTVKEFRK